MVDEKTREVLAGICRDCSEAIGREGDGARIIVKARSRPRRPRGGRIRVLAGVIGVVLDDSREPGWWVVSVPAAKMLKAIEASSS